MLNVIDVTKKGEGLRFFQYIFVSNHLYTYFEHKKNTDVSAPFFNAS